MNIALLDYGVGNLHSLAKALVSPGHRVRIASSAAEALRADALVLPGVGNFGAAAQRIAPERVALHDALLDGMPCLGICLGMQLLFEASEEAEGAGIGIFAGAVTRLQTERVPHMGWNQVDPHDDAIFTGTAPLVAYFANSYVCAPTDPAATIAWTEYGDTRFPAAVRRGSTWGVQFHPEKSAAPGLRLLHNFLAAVAP